jgi:hypothetical protein
MYQGDDAALRDGFNSHGLHQMIIFGSLA